MSPDNHTAFWLMSSIDLTFWKATQKSSAINTKKSKVIAYHNCCCEDLIKSVHDIMACHFESTCILFLALQQQNGTTPKNGYTSNKLSSFGQRQPSNGSNDLSARNTINSRPFSTPRDYTNIPPKSNGRQFPKNGVTIANSRPRNMTGEYMPYDVVDSDVWRKVSPRSVLRFYACCDRHLSPDTSRKNHGDPELSRKVKLRQL